MKKLVSARLQAQVAGPHPDPELLAAFAENGLLPGDRDMLLTHLAACTDCRDALYLAMPEAEAQPVFQPSYKAPRLALRWATLAASVIIVGAFLMTNREMFDQHSSRIQTYSETPTQNVAELKVPKTQAPADKRAPAVSAAGKVLPPVKHMTARPQANMQFDNSDQVRFSAPPAAASAANEVVSAQVQSAGNAPLPARDAAKAMRTPDWSISPAGQVQHSFDSGRTWQIIPVAEGASFRAIAALGNEVWAGGNAGALYHSIDAGQNWAKVDPVSTDDITHIEFSDPLNGSLNTANGEIWRTSDGGRSWHSK